MDWMIWILVISLILNLTNGKIRDEDTELKESFYRLLDYSDEFDEFLHSRNGDEDDDDRFDPDNELFKDSLPKEILESIASKRLKKKETLTHIRNNEEISKKNTNEYKESNNERSGDKTHSLNKKETSSNDLKQPQTAFKKSEITRPKHDSRDNNSKKKETAHNSESVKHSKIHHAKASDTTQNNIEFRNSKTNDLSLESVKSSVANSDSNVYEGRTIIEEVNEPEMNHKRDEKNPKVAVTAVPTVAPSATLPKSHVESTKKDTSELNDVFFVVIIVACSLACIAGLALAGYCWYRLRREAKEVEANESSPFTGGAPDNSKLKKSDEKLAKSAEMYHYVHSKNQLTALHAKDGGKGKSKTEASDSSEDESDNTIYECSGLAPPGDMKVVNPLFSDVDNRQSDTKSEGSVSPSRDLHTPKSSESHDISQK